MFNLLRWPYFAGAYFIIFLYVSNEDVNIQGAFKDFSQMESCIECLVFV